MLQVLVSGYAPEKAPAASSIISNMNRMEAYCQGAPQQSANGLDASASLVELLVDKIDANGKYRSRVSTITRIKVQNNAMCQGADQQSGNYLYRIVELAQVITDVFMDEEEALAAKRFQEYWAAHAEEKQKLQDEKAELNKKISEVKKRASAVNANEEIAPIKEKITQLTKEKNSVSTAAVTQVYQEIQRKEAELSQVGFFKFSLRKELKAQLLELSYKKSAAEADVKKAKDAIQQEIDSFQREIDKLNADVDKKRKAILSENDQYNSRIKKIDNELTKPR
jgi:chromosome segregation ATPase